MIVLQSQYDLGIIAKIKQSNLLLILIMNFSIAQRLGQVRMRMLST